MCVCILVHSLGKTGIGNGQTTMVGLLLAFLLTQQGSSEPGFLLRLVVSNLCPIPREFGPGQVCVCPI